MQVSETILRIIHGNCKLKCEGKIKKVADFVSGIVGSFFGGRPAFYSFF